MAPSSEEPNQLQPPAAVPSTLERTPATAPVRAGTSVLADIGNNRITERAEHIRASTDESMVWQESPSLTLLVPRGLKYLAAMIVLMLVCGAVRHFVARNPIAQAVLAERGIHSNSAHHARHARKPVTDDSADSTTAADSEPAPVSSGAVTIGRLLLWVQVLFGLFFAGLLLLYLLKLKTTRYAASSQRLIVESGSLHTVNRPYELHQLGDAVIEKPLLLRFFNVSNLVILEPRIELLGLRNAEYVRDILRQGGQLEAQRADKVRWR